MKVLVLDAMGVIYAVGDDVRDLLCPFIEEKGGTKDISKIEMLYQSASLGDISAAELWEGVGLNPQVEEEYLQRHKLTDGLVDFLETIKARCFEVWCLSNDLSEWSRKLRLRFGLDQYLRGFVISGEVGLRKPAQTILELLMRNLDVSPHEVMFVDDQKKNLDSAAVLGFNTVLFAPASGDLTNETYQVATTFNDILSILSRDF